MPSLADLVVNLTAETAAFTKKLDEAHRDAKKFADDVTGTLNKVADVGKLLGEAFAVEQIASWVEKVASAETQMARLAQSTGVGVETLSGLSLAAKANGLDMESLAKGLEKLDKNAAAAASGSKEASKGFELLGVKVTGASGHLKSTEELMLEVSDRFSGMEDGSGKTAIAMEVFGKAGAALIPMLNEGREGLEDWLRQAKALGVELDERSVKAAESFHRQVVLLDAGVDGLARRIVNPLLPSLTSLVSAMVDEMKDPESPMATAVEFLTNRLKDLTAVATGGLYALKLFGEEVKYEGAQEILTARGDVAGLVELERAHSAKNEQLRTDTLDQIGSLYDPLSTTGDRKKRTPSPLIANDEMKGYAAKLAGFQDELNGIQVDIAKANENVIAVIEAQWTARLAKLAAKFDELPPKLQAKARAAYQIALQESGFAERNELDAAGKKLLDQANKAFEEWTKDHARVLPQFIASAGVRPAFKPDIAGAELDRFVKDIQAQGTLADQVMQQAMTNAQRYSLELQKLNILLGRGLITQEAYNKGVIALRNDLDTNTIAIREFGQEAEQALSQAVLNSGDWHNALSTILDDLAQMILKMTVLKDYQGGGGLFGAIASGVVGFFSGSTLPTTSAGAGGFGAAGSFGIGSGPVTQFSLPGRAAGGGVLAGHAYMVGENGPEPFIPPFDGTILPNRFLKSGDDAPKVHVNVINQGTPKTAQASQPRFDRAARQMVVDVILSDIRQDGPLRAAIANK